jgi:hypothetical protein
LIEQKGNINMSLLKALNLPPPKASSSKNHTAAASTATQTPAHPAKPSAATTATVAPGTQHKATKAPKLNQNNYGALLVAIENEAENWNKPNAAIDTGAFAASDLVSQHRQLLMHLHAAIALMKTDPAGALQLWEKIGPALRSEVNKASAAGVPAEGVTLSLDQLKWFEEKIFVPAAYWAAEREAEGGSTLVAPDVAQFSAKLKLAESELKQANELFEKGLTIATGIGKVMSYEKPKEVKEIIELVMLPGTIEEKLKEAKKRGIATTVAELVSKVTGTTSFLVKTVGEVGHTVIQARKALVLAKGVTKATKEAAEKLETLAVKFEGLAKAGKTLGQLATAATIIADGFKLVTALKDGDFSEAGGALADLAVDVVPLVAGEAAGVALAGIIGLAKIEMAAIHMAAEFIRYCKDETVRQAAESFIKDCNKVAKIARLLVADCEVMISASNAAVQEIAAKKADKEAAVVSQAIRQLSSHVTSNSKQAIGGHPGVVAALGGPANVAMTVTFGPEDGALLVAQQIADVFHGANQMAKYVKATYTN